MLNIQRIFPGYFHNIIFVSAGVLDLGTSRGPTRRGPRGQGAPRSSEVRRASQRPRWPANETMGTEAVDVAENLCRQIAKKYSRASSPEN
jgi:hypothetical protein